MEPTIEQLSAFYRVVRQSVLMSSHIIFVELGEDRNLYIWIGRNEPESIFIVYITPSGEFENYAQ
jgi:hypothetical protein